MFDQTAVRRPSSRALARQVAEHFHQIEYERIAEPRADGDRLHYHRRPISVLIAPFSAHTAPAEVAGKIWVNTGNCIQLMTHAEYDVGAVFGHWRKATFAQFHQMPCVRG